MDLGHVVLIGLIVAVVVFKLRTTHRRNFHITLIIQRSTQDEAESTRDRHKLE